MITTSYGGEEFVGPHDDSDHDWEGDLDISAIVQGVDLTAIVEQHDPDLA
jgi:hypothetical protein